MDNGRSAYRDSRQRAIVIAVTAIFTFTSGVLFARGEFTMAVAMLLALAVVWVLTAVKSA
jgi:hypothetical protein